MEQPHHAASRASMSHPHQPASTSSSSNPLFQLHHPDASRPYPIRTMSSSAAQSPFFQSTRRGSQSYAIPTTSNGSVPRESGNSPDSVSSSASGARFGVIGGSPTTRDGAYMGGSFSSQTGGTVQGNQVRWGGSGLRNTLARGSHGGWGGQSGSALGLGGTQTRSSSFSGRETRSPRLVEEMPSHIEESWLDKYKSSSSPFPTFSDTSSPPASPPMPRSRLVGHGTMNGQTPADRRESNAHDSIYRDEHELDLRRPHSPPRAEANVSRSRSQSMAPGVLRPQFAGHGGFGNGLFGGGGVLHGFTGMDQGGQDGPGGSRGYGAGERMSPWADSGRNRLVDEASSSNNVSPFAAGTRGDARTSAQDPRLGIAGEGRRFVHGQDTYSGSAEKYNNPTHETLTSSVHAALAGFDPYAHERSQTQTQTHDRYVTTGAVGGIGNGGQSGSSSRRHSISVAGGPSARRGFQIPGFGFSEALVSPEIEGRFPLHGDDAKGQGRSQYAQGGFGAAERGRQAGFSDADLLAADMGTSLAIHDEPVNNVNTGGYARSTSVTRDSSASMRDEARSRFDAAQTREWQANASPFVPGGYGTTFVPRAVNGGSAFTGNQPGYGGSFVPPPNNGNGNNAFGPGNGGYGGYQPGRGNDYGGMRPPHQQQQQYQHQPQVPKWSPFAPGQAPSFVGSIGSGPAPITHQAMNDMGKGVPVQMLNPITRLFIVEFKAGRTDLFYTPDPNVTLQLGDLVIVEADRGQDLGKVKEDKITVDDVRSFNLARKQEMDVNGPMSARIKGALTNILVGEANAEAGVNGPNPNPAVKAVQRELMPKRIFGKAGPADRQLLTAKLQDEAQALALCQQRVKQKRLPMEVLDAEYQWDRRKLTFYFIAEKRIDFRELVRELFRIHKTRIWMASLDHSYLQDDENKS